MHLVSSGRSFRELHLFPSVRRPFLIARLASAGLKKSMIVWAVRWLGALLSRGLIHRMERMVLTGRSFSLSISLRVFGSSMAKRTGTYSVMTEKGLEARDTSVPNLAAKACCPLVDLSQVTVSSESTSYSRCQDRVSSGLTRGSRGSGY